MMWSVGVVGGSSWLILERGRRDGGKKDGGKRDGRRRDGKC